MSPFASFPTIKSSPISVTFPLLSITAACSFPAFLPRVPPDAPAPLPSDLRPAEVDVS